MEYRLAKARVAGSNPVSCLKKIQYLCGFAEDTGFFKLILCLFLTIFLTVFLLDKFCLWPEGETDKKNIPGTFLVRSGYADKKKTLRT